MITEKFNFQHKFNDFQNVEKYQKNEVFQLQVIVVEKVVSSRKSKICQKLRIEPYF